MIGALKCRIGLHKGYADAVEGTMYFYCTRCNEHLYPTEL